MKKLALLLAALLMCTSLTFTACSESGNSGDGDKKPSSNNKDNDNDKDKDEDEEKAEEYVLFSFDESTGKYESNFLGIGAELDPEEWESIDAELYNGTSDVEELRKKLESTTNTVFELMVIKEDNTNISVAVGNVEKMTEEAYVDYSIKNLDAITEGQISNAEAEKVTMKIGGKDHVCLVITGNVEEVDVCELMIFINKGDLMGMITITSFDRETVEDIATMFYAL